jgi:hypothetical protein
MSEPRFELHDERKKISPKNLQELGRILNVTQYLVVDSYEDKIADEDRARAMEGYPVWADLMRKVPLSTLLFQVAVRLESEAIELGADIKLLD